MNGGNGRGKGLLWNLPHLKTKDVGKVGPAFGFGAGCGIGLGFGLMGAAGFGPGIPGLHLGFGIGVGCGLGAGFGYGIGKGIAYDDGHKYSNVGKLFRRGGRVPSEESIDALVGELISNTKKIAHATSKEIEKWRR